MIKIITPKEAWLDIIDEVLKTISKYTVQILAIDESENRSKIPIPIATGILIENKNKYFLISAAHIFNNPPEYSFWFGCGDRLFQIRKIEQIINPNKNGINNKIDLFYFILEKEIIDSIKETNDFLNFKHISFNHKKESLNNYLIYGYPNTYTKIDKSKNKTVQTKALSYHTGLVKNHEETLKKLKLHKEINLLLNYSIKDGVKYSNNLRIFNPNPTGLSGSGIWFLPSPFIEKGKDVPFFLVGIGIENIKEKNIIIGTNIDVPFNLFNI